MRFIHTADWHLGRYFHGVHLTEDQGTLLREQFLPLVKDEKVDAVVIAGDIYDRAVPPVEAVDLFSEILTKLVEQKVKVLYIAGNHDSAARIGFGSRLMEQSGVFVRGELSRDLSPVIFEDSYGEIAFQLFPYLDPGMVRQVFPASTEEMSLTGFNEANKLVVDEARKVLPEGMRSVAVAHAFLAGGQESDSERPLAVGGSGNVQPGIFKGYDYVALGHLHNPQQVGVPTVRYSGSLMKYSFNEAQTDKCVSVVDIDGEGEVSREDIPLHPARDVRRIRGEFESILSDDTAYPPSEDYIQADLTDKRRVLNVQEQLRRKFPNIMHINWAGLAAVREDMDLPTHKGMERQQLTDEEKFHQFFREKMGREMDEEERAVLADCIREVHKEEREKA